MEAGSVSMLLSKTGLDCYTRRIHSDWPHWPHPDGSVPDLDLDQDLAKEEAEAEAELQRIYLVKTAGISRSRSTYSSTAHLRY